MGPVSDQGRSLKFYHFKTHTLEKRSGPDTSGSAHAKQISSFKTHNAFIKTAKQNIFLVICVCKKDLDNPKGLEVMFSTACITTKR